MQWGAELRGEERLALRFLRFRAEDSGFQLTQILKGGYCSEDVAYLRNLVLSLKVFLCFQAELLS